MPDWLPTAAQVQVLLSSTVSQDIIDAAIADAYLVLGNCADLYEDARNAAIVKYLAAHLINSGPSGKSSSLKSESVDGTSYSFGGATTGEGLKGTALGQQALLLDHEGCLQDREKQQVKFVAL